MVNNKKLMNIIFLIWMILMIVLWVLYPFLPGDIFIWMVIAIAWSALGGIASSVYYAMKSKRNLLIVIIIWVVIVAFFWINDFVQIIPIEETLWFWITWTATGGLIIVALGILPMKLLKKTEW